MRIAYITADFGIPVFGNKGASIHVRELCNALEKQGHDVRVFTPRLGGERPRSFNAPVHEVTMDRSTKSVITELNSDPSAGDVMTREIRSIIYSAELKRRALETFSTWRPDAIYERYSLLATAGADLSRELNIPHILEVNAPLSMEAAVHRGLAFAHTVGATERRILQSADSIVAVSEPLKQWIIEQGVCEERVRVLPNGANSELFESRTLAPPIRGSSDTRAVIGFVGTLKEWHGTNTLLSAVAMLARSSREDQAPRLLIVGDGPQREALLAQAFEEGIGHLVTFTGAVPHETMPEYIAQMDVAVAPYDRLPNFYFSPLKLFEYMAAGKAIVASDIGQISEILRDRETGLLYEPGNVEQLADCIARLIDQPSLAKSLSASARAAAIQNHSWDRNAVAVEELIKQHLAAATDPVLAGGSK